MRRIRLANVACTAAFVALAVGASGCSSGGGSSSATPSSEASSAASGYGKSPSAPASSASASAQATVKTATAGKLGTILVDAKGRTLYLFEADKSTQSTCNGSCAAAWPPLLTSGSPTAGGSAKSGLLGTTKRSDGKSQVTYHGHPLYGYAGDSKPGDTNGQDLNQFGAAWYVLDVSGQKVD
ncbi:MULTISPECIES: COG4315 family predicted lipoprotein [unclassified Streptomyces]|uniref:COG4315 family predicted lipoprotein n=1 Tax=unclassified Streptomyces TaxID=2593676 RepID=UPI002E2756C4